MVNRSTVYQLLDNLTSEQMDAIISRAREIVNMIDCADEVTDYGTEHNSIEMRPHIAGPDRYLGGDQSRL